MNGVDFQNRALQLMEQTNEQLNQMNKKLNELSEDVSQIKIAGIPIQTSASAKVFLHSSLCVGVR